MKLSSVRGRNLVSTCRDFRNNERGAIAIMTACYMTVAIGALALAIDLGTISVERREAQGAVDLAAIAAAADLDHAEAAAKATLAANGLDNLGPVTVERGRYLPDVTVAHQLRFTAGAQPYNAVRVGLTKQANSYFSNAFAVRYSYEIAVSAISSNASLATFSIGSRLLAVRGGVVNDILGGLLGSNVSLSVMDYDALINGNISLLPFLNALATRLDLTAGTYNDVLTSRVTMGDVLSAMATAAGSSGQSNLSVALQRLYGQTVGANIVVPMSSVLNLGPIGALQTGSQVAGLNADFKAMDFVNACATMANGKKQLSVNLNVNIPGIVALKLDVAVGEPMQQSSWAAVGQPTAKVYTAQTRVRLTAQVGGAGSLAGASIRLPLYFDIAYASAQLASVVCTTGGSQSATVAATPGIADVWIGETRADMAAFGIALTVTPAAMVNLALAKVTGQAHVNVGNATATTLAFTAADIASGTIQRTDTRNFMQSVVTSVLKDLKLQVQVLGLGIGTPGALTSDLVSSLNAVAAPLDDVVYNILGTLGVHLGEADVTVQGLRCLGGGNLAG